MAITKDTECYSTLMLRVAVIVATLTLGKLKASVVSTKDFKYFKTISTKIYLDTAIFSRQRPIVSAL